MGCGKSSPAYAGTIVEEDGKQPQEKIDKKVIAATEGEDVVLPGSVPENPLDKQHLPPIKREESVDDEDVGQMVDRRPVTRHMEFRTAGSLPKIVSSSVGQKYQTLSDETGYVDDIPEERGDMGLSEDEETDDEALITEVGIKKENLQMPPSDSSF